MAFFKIHDYIDIGTKCFHDATSWQVGLDSEFTEIIDESLHDTTNLLEWHSMLPKIGDPGQYYADLDNLYARVKVHMGDDVSDWFNLPVKNQNDQTIIVTDLNGVDTSYNSLTNNFN